MRVPAAGDHLSQRLTWRERYAPRTSSRVVERIRASVIRERWFSACMAIIGVHVAVVGLFAAARAPVRVVLLLAAVLGPPALVLAFATHGRVVRVVLAGIAGLAAMAAGLATSIPRVVLTGIDAAGIVGVAASLAGLALVVLAYRIALRGRRLAVKVGCGRRREPGHRAVADRAGAQRRTDHPRAPAHRRTGGVARPDGCPRRLLPRRRRRSAGRLVRAG